MDDLTRPERRRFWTVWALFGLGLGIPLWLLLPRLTDDSTWDAWLHGAAGGLASGLALALAVKDLARRRPE